MNASKKKRFEDILFLLSSAQRLVVASLKKKGDEVAEELVRNELSDVVARLKTIVLEN